jgi:FdhE protein
VSRPAASDPFDTLPRSHPEWAVWLALLRKAHASAEDPRWTAALTAMPHIDPAGERPLLAALTLAVDRATAVHWTRDVCDAAAAGTRSAAGLAHAARREAFDALVLLQAAVNDDGEALDTLAREIDADPAPVHALAPLLALPLLQGCARSPAGQVPAGWCHGYCPTCGGWPALAEARGLERSRHLRCGRCGGDWRTEWMRCPYCGTGEHTRLGALVSEVTGETRKVDTCGECGGYLKTLMTLTARSPVEVNVDDLTTVALDLAALERGYRRPQGLGHPLGVTIAAALPRTGALRRWLR